MVLLANRVSALVPAPIMASTSVTPSERAASTTCSKIASQRYSGNRSSGIGAPDPNVAEARRRCAVSGSHDLLGLPLPAIRRAPKRPVLRSGDGGAGVPELRADPAVARILEHPSALAPADLPGDLAAELKVVPLIVDRPTLVRLHVNGVIG